MEFRVSAREQLAMSQERVKPESLPLGLLRQYLSKIRQWRRKYFCSHSTLVLWRTKAPFSAIQSPMRITLQNLRWYVCLFERAYMLVCLE